MGRRIEVELTSSREDGSWTWRAAGAKKPKGSLDGSVLYEGAQVGDVVKADAEYHVDGIEITEVMPPTSKKQRTDILEMKPRQLRDDELVTTQRVKKNDRGGRKGRGGQGRSRDNRGSSRPQRRDEQPQRPKPKRLRPKRVHREALLTEIGVEHRPIIEQLLRDGMPGVRKAIEKQNAEAKEAGKPEVDATPILAIAENNISKARVAEWRDKADAALADADELDLRDLRSVVVSGADIARDDENRELSDQLKAALDRRVDADHQAWLTDLENAVKQERVVRALRLSSRPVKAGAPLPAEMATKLSTQASAALSSEVTQDRWATVLDALAFSPVRSAVTPAGIPAEPKEELLTDVRRLSDRVPSIAKLFGIDPADVPKSAKRRRPRRRKPGQKKDAGKKTGSSEQGKKAEAKSEAPKPATDASAKVDKVPTAPVDDQKPAEKPAPTPEPAAEKPGPTPEPVPAEPVVEPATEEPEPTPEPVVEPATEEPEPTPEPASDAGQPLQPPEAESAVPSEVASVDTDE